MNILIPYFFQKKSAWGFIYSCGKVSSLPLYEDVNVFSEGLAPVRLKGLWGYIDEGGKYKISPKFQETEPFCNGFAIVYDNLGYGLIDKEQNYHISPKYDHLGLPQNGICLAAKSRDEIMSFGYLYKNGDVVIPFIYDDSSGFDEQGWALVENNNKYWFIDSNNKIVYQNDSYEKIMPFFEDVAVVRRNGLYGYISRDGIEILPCKYDYAEPYSEGLFLVKSNGRWIYLLLDGTPAFHMNFEQAEPFENGHALFALHDKWGLLNREGKIVVPPIYNEIRKIDESLPFYQLWEEDDTMCYFNSETPQTIRI